MIVKLYDSKLIKGMQQKTKHHSKALMRILLQNDPQ